MNKKAIQKHLTRKFNQWSESIKDEKVKKLVEKNTIITGGSIASMLIGEPPNDYDIYFTNKETVKAVAKYYIDIFNENNKGEKNKLGYKHKAFVIDGAEDIPTQIRDAGEWEWKTKMLEEIPEDRIKIIVRSDGAGVDKGYKQAFEEADEINADLIEEVDNESEEKKEKYRPIFLSTNAITLSNKIQVVIRFYGCADKIHENFDFAHCMNYWQSENKKVTTNIDALESLLSKNLKYNGSKYPLASVIRTRKFIKRGFHISAGEYLKMCFQLSELDLTDINVLEEQLCGVDTLYFKMLIDAIQKAQENNENFKLDNDYVCSLVDKIF